MDHALSPELISDDPRREVEDSPIAEAKRFMAFVKRGGGLTIPQLAACAGVSSQAIRTLVKGGSLSSEKYFDSRWIPREDCAAYLAKRQMEPGVRGPGVKNVTIKELWKATAKDMGI